MAAIGCLLLIILPIVSLTLGGLLAGAAGLRWGAALGFGVALLVCGVTAYGFTQMRRR